ncbi:hypothetical protein OAF54_02795 [bacterium]|nr:hypothetical protein [bacterium]
MSAPGQKTMHVDKRMIDSWMQSLQEVSEGCQVRMTTNHADNIERAYMRSQLLTAKVLAELSKVVNG